MDTPLADILGEFFYTEKQYLGLMKEYALQYPDRVSLSACIDLCSQVTDTINEIVLEFSCLHMNLAAERLASQQELVVEMSAPVIQLGEKIGLLPLVGEVQAERAKVILEQTVDQSVQKGLDVLFIDLSGVAVIDTMVAQQIFQLTDALKLIGVTPALAGVGPHIAQTAVQLGINFADVPIYSTLTQALAFRTNHTV